MKATIPTAALKAELVSDVESSRYALGGVLLCDGRAVATDGRGMVVLQWKDEPTGEPVIVPSETCRALRKAVKQVPERAEFAVERDKLTIECECAGVIGKPVEGRFPKWQDCVPDTDDSIHICIQPELLSRLLTILAGFSGDRVMLSVPKKYAEALVITGRKNDHRAMAILMPCKHAEDGSLPAPMWVPEKPPKQQAEPDSNGKPKRKRKAAKT